MAILTLGQVGVHYPANKNRNAEVVLVTGVKQYVNPGAHDYLIMNKSGQIETASINKVGYLFTKEGESKVFRGEFATRKMFGKLTDKLIKANKAKYMEYLGELNGTVKFDE